jgi:hypothetical protein
LRINFVKAQGTYDKYPNQFEPFQGLFDCNIKGSEKFQGTLFRFPLRTSTDSKISTSTYDKEIMLQMLESFMEEAAMDVLSLKHVERVKIYHRTQDTQTLIYELSVTPAEEQDQIKRQRINDLLKNAIETVQSTEKSIFDNYTYRLNVRQQFIRSERVNNQEWIVSCCLGSGRARQLARETFKTRSDLRMIPWGSVTACISDDARDGLDLALQDSRAYCFLPLPSSTGLPVHMNSFFELSSNRRDLWKGSQGLEGEAAMRSMWNEALKSDVLGPAYAYLLRQVRRREHQLSDEAYYTLFPKSSEGSEWEDMVNSCYQTLKAYDKTPLFRTMHNTLTSAQDAVVAADLEEYKNECTAVNELVSRHRDVVSTLPEFIEEGFVDATVPLHKVTPAYVRDYLREEKGLGAFPVDLVLQFMGIDRKFQELIGVPIIKLANGSMVPISTKEKSPAVFITTETEHAILSQVAPTRIIDAQLQHSCKSILQSLCSISNIAVITENDFSVLLLYFFGRGEEKQWNEQKVPIALLHKITEYLTTVQELPLFTDMSMILTTSNTLVPMNATPLVDEDEILSQPVTEALNKIGVRFVDKRVAFSALKRVSFSTVLNRILEIYKSETLTTELKKKLNDSQKRCIFEWLLNVHSHKDDNSNIVIMKLLPIFETYAKTFVALSEGAVYLPPDGLAPNLEVLLDERFVRCTSANRYFLSNDLHAQEMRKSDFYLEGFQKVAKLDKTILEMLMLAVLDDLSQVSKENPQFLNALKAVSFVPTKAGLTTPTNVYDPRVDELKFLPQEWFPIGRFAEEEVLTRLELCGMMRELSPLGFVSLRKKIHEEKSLQSAQDLLSYMSQKETMFKKDVELWTRAIMGSKQAAEEFKWMPVTAAKKQGLSAVKHTRPKEDTDLVATVLPICVIDVTSATLKHILQWDVPPALPNVIKHLSNMSQQFKQLTANQESRERIIAASDRITEMTTRVYQYLENFLSTSDNEDMKQTLIKELKSFASVWTGDRFTDVSQIAMTSSRMLNLQPYLYEVPVTFKNFIVLVENLKIKQEFETTDLLRVLNHLQQVHGQVPFSMQENNLKLAVNILQAIYKDTKTVTTQAIIAPTAAGKFAPAKTLIYVDSKELFERLHGSMDDFTSILIHPELSNEVSKNLGAKSLTRHIEETSSELLQDDYGETFGQREKLTQRIGNILKDYPATEATVFKEMLQNAEDAKATRFAVIFDKRTFGKETLVNEELAAFQGPSLLIYNDSIFTDDDIRGIQQLGVPNKLSSLSKIGRFAIGFNSVYHYTDLPSFVSLDKLILLDAHAKYVRGATNAHPGRLYRYTNKGFVESFDDQVSVFRSMGCNMNTSSFNGTLFRLPLRTKQQAEKSEISKHSWDNDTVMSQLETFIAEARDCLLFLKNVKRISVFVQHADENNALEQLLDIQTIKSTEVAAMETDLAKCIDQLEEIAEELPSNFKKSKKKKVEKSMFNRFFSGVSEILGGSFSSQVQKRLGKIDIHISSKDPTTKAIKQERETWIISGCVGGNEAYDLALQNVKRAERKYRLVPHAAVAIKYDDFTTAEDIKSLDGRAFSFLPLPIETGLSVHINSFFELGTSRRDLWQSKLGEKRNESHFDVRDKWNRVLLSNCVAPALMNLIEWLCINNSESNRSRVDKQKIFYRIMDLAPQKSRIGANPLMTTLLSPFYTSLSHFQAFYSQSTPNALLSMRSINLDSPQGQNEKEKHDHKHDRKKQPKRQVVPTRVLRSQLHEMLINDSFPLVIVPDAVIEGLKDAVDYISFVTPKNVRIFYNQFFSNQMNQRILREKAAADAERARKHKKLLELQEKLREQQREQGIEEEAPQPVQAPSQPEQTVRDYVEKLWDFCIRTNEDVDASHFVNFPILMVSGTVMFASPQEHHHHKTHHKGNRKNSFWSSSSPQNDVHMYYTDKEALIKNLIPWKAADFVDIDFIKQLAGLVPKHNKDDDKAFWTQLGITQLTPALFYEFLCQHMPQRLILTQRASFTTYVPNSTSQPTTEWLLDIWKYLEEHSDDTNRELFSQLALIPTADRKLYRIISGKEVIHVTPEQPASMVDILTVLQVPVALPEFCQKFQTLRKVTSPLNDNILIESLHKLNADRFNALNDDQRRMLLQFFNARNLSREELHALASLPLFELTNGEFCSLNQYRDGNNRSRIFIESKKCKLPHCPSSVKILKKQNRSLKVLYIELGAKKALDENLYREYILHAQAFSSLSDQQQAQHLNHILETPVLRNALKQQIAELPFLNGKKPSECYDPENECFKLFITDHNYFPSPPYDSEEWIQFLKKDLGLISKVNTEFLLKCHITDSDINIARYKATVLLNQLYTKQKGLIFDDTKFLKEMASKRILPIKELDRSYCFNKNQKCFDEPRSNGLQPITSCVDPKYTDIAFTSAYIYDEEYSDVVEAVCNRIAQPASPKASVVMEHLCNLSHIQPEDLGQLEVQRICIEIYRYLSKPPLKANTEARDQKLIYMDGYFLNPQKFFFKMDENYAPFIYKVPDDYFEFTKLFAHWGVEEKPSVTFCNMILKTMREKCKEAEVEVLTPTEVELCLKIIRLLVSEHGSTLQGSFLVTTKRVLAPHRSVLVDDAPYLRQRINVDEFDLLHQDLSDLASKLALKTISSVITEQLKTITRETPIYQTEITNTMTNALKMKQFTPSLARLLRHSIGAEIALPLEKISELTAYACCEVDVLKCAYIDSRNGHDVTRGDYESGTHCVLDTKAVRIYISRRIPSYLDPYVIVARSINQHLGFTGNDATILSLMLKCKSGEQMEKILDDFNITSVVGSDTNLNRKVGERVVLEDLKYFIPADPDTHFTIGETIAFEDVNPVTREGILRYGKITKRLEHHQYHIERAPHVSFTVHINNMRKFVNASDMEKTEDEVLKSTVPPPNNGKIVHEALMQSLVCPITQEVFSEPVILSDGNTYEKSAILQWLSSRDTSPLTREKLSSKVLLPNYLIKSLIKEYIDCD